MMKLEVKKMILPIETELERIIRMVSKTERRKNGRLRKQMRKLYSKLQDLRLVMAPKQLQWQEAV